MTNRFARLLVGLLLGLLPLLTPLVGLGVAAPSPALADTSPYSVFVGYADNLRADAAHFPTPWYGDAGVTFEGCGSTSSCTYDAGAVRIVNNTATTLTVDSVHVKLDTCDINLWTSAMQIPFGGQLILTQTRSGAGNGCPNDGTMDTSDIGKSNQGWAGNCSLSGITPEVDVSVNGASAAFYDNALVLNTGQVDQASCGNGSAGPAGNESAQWQLIGGSTPCIGPAKLALSPSSQQALLPGSATVTAHLANSCDQPLAGAPVSISVLSGPNAGKGAAGTTNSNGDLPFTYSYSGPASGNDSLQASVTNAVGTFSSNPATVTWTNPPPTVHAGTSYSGNEGSAIALSNATASDTDGDALTYAWSVTSAPESGATCSFAPSATILNPSVTCNEEGSYTLQLAVNDGYNAAVTDTATLSVSDVAPQISITAPTQDQLFQVGSPGGPAAVSVTAPFTDAGTLDAHTCSIQWDTAQPWTSYAASETVGSGSGNCNVSNNLNPGVYLITVKVQDSDGTLFTQQTVEIVVYDPSSGFVTGGGWINSPAGAMPSNPSLTGRANFGFVSKYQKGASAPTGQTEFQFQVGNLNFHSTGYTVLTISGSQAQYRGSGTINGANDSAGNPYKFILTARDGDMNGGTNPDGFRMKITDSSGNVVYDNLPAATDDIGNTQVIAGGDIKIHS